MPAKLNLYFFLRYDVNMKMNALLSPFFVQLYYLLYLNKINKDFYLTYKWTKIPFHSGFLQKPHFGCGVYVCVLSEDFCVQFLLLFFLIFANFKLNSVS